MERIFAGTYFFFCASMSDAATHTPDRGMPLLDVVIRNGGGLLSSLPRAPVTQRGRRDSCSDEGLGCADQQPNVSTVLAIGTPSECYFVREAYRKNKGGHVSNRVVFVRPAYISDCVAANRPLPVGPYEVFRPSQHSNDAPVSSNAHRGPAAGHDFESLELAVAVEMHRAAREIEEEIAWRKRLPREKSGSPRVTHPSNVSRSSSVSSVAERHWMGTVDEKLAAVIQQGRAVVGESRTVT
uniref:BRCT domain-containing protein n=1 Tax=Neobodo designis TaxID=312471 RepID=A0A7S1QPN3_NEODS